MPESFLNPPIAAVGAAANYLHAPDGFFSVPVSTILWVVSIVVIFVALRMTGRQLSERMVPALGVFAAFIFAAQMFNFPVAGGTSGHLIGAALVAIVLGPWAAIVVMSAVVSFQALMFQDGGLVVMGSNIFNIGIMPVVVSYSVFRLGRNFARTPQAVFAIAAVAAWISVEAGALATAAQLSISGTSPFSVAAPAMLGVHALIGIGEAAITGGALVVVYRSRRDLFSIGRVVPEAVMR